MLSCFIESGPSFGLHINLSKSELYLLSGNSIFILQSSVSHESGGLELLCIPYLGTSTELQCLFSVTFDKFIAIQDKLVDLEDPQVDLETVVVLAKSLFLAAFRLSL